jgi:MFS family permease
LSPAATLRRTFSSLSNSNYRRFFIGQTTSLVGTWMQITAQSWLVYTLTHSATDLGFVVALQTLPILLFGPYGGVIADRVDKRRFMVILQSCMGLQAVALAVLTLTHTINFTDVLILATILGLNNCFENPSRQSFVLEMVGPDELRNAVSLNSTLNNVARAVGPAVAGLIIALVGVGWCFALNAVSFVAVVYSLTSMDLTKLHPTVPTTRAKGQLRAGLSYVRHTPGLLVPLIMMALVGTFAYEFQVTLPVVADHLFHGASATYGLLLGAMGAGAVVGGLVTAARGKTGLTALIRASSIFAAAMLAACFAPNLVVEFVAIAVVGFASVSFLSMANSTLQLRTDAQMRGRVMALWAVAFMGSTPIGGPLIGLITNTLGVRVGLGTGALSCAVAAGLGYALLRYYRKRREEANPHQSQPTLPPELPNA